MRSGVLVGMRIDNESEACTAQYSDCNCDDGYWHSALGGFKTSAQYEIIILRSFYGGTGYEDIIVRGGNDAWKI